MMEFPYPISDMLLQVLMLEEVGANYLGVGVGPPPFSADHPLLASHPFTEMMSEPPALPSKVE